MGFLSKAFKKVKKQIQPGQMPKRGGGFGNLGEAIRRMQEQGGMGMKSDGIRSDPRIPGGMFSPGGTPGFYDREMAKVNPIRPGMDDGRMRAMPIGPGARLQMPEGLPSMEQMPAEIDISALERLPMGDQPMLKDLPDVDSVGMMSPGMRNMQPRVRMAEGDEVFMPSNPNQIAFSIETEIKNLMNEYEMAANNGEIERAQRVAKQINELEARRIQAMNEAKAMESGRTISDMDRQQTGRTISDLGRGRTISDLDRGRTISDMDRQIGMMYGGEMKGYADGGEIEAMLGGMDSGEQEAMGEVEQMAPEMEMIDQLVMMVVQMIQQGAGEEQVISFLREQGLDDEDIGTVLQLVSEMAETEEMAAQNEIGTDLEQLG